MAEAIDSNFKEGYPWSPNSFRLKKQCSFVEPIKRKRKNRFDFTTNTPETSLDHRLFSTLPFWVPNS